MKLTNIRTLIIIRNKKVWKLLQRDKPVCSILETNYNNSSRILSVKPTLFCLVSVGLQGSSWLNLTIIWVISGEVFLIFPLKSNLMETRKLIYTNHMAVSVRRKHSADWDCLWIDECIVVTGPNSGQGVNLLLLFKLILHGSDMILGWPVASLYNICAGDLMS